MYGYIYIYTYCSREGYQFDPSPNESATVCQLDFSPDFPVTGAVSAATEIFCQRVLHQGARSERWWEMIGETSGNIQRLKDQSGTMGKSEQS